MRSFIPWLFGLFVGWTMAAIYIAVHEDKLHQQVEEECAKRLVAEFERERARSRELSAKVELDRIRRNWMHERAQWWRPIPLAVADEGERIPATNLPTRCP
jgi:hypothetical protein